MARIVIVDDNLMVRRTLADILMGAGHEIVGEAVDGLEAPVRVHDLQPDLVTLDLMMPGRGGMLALKHMRMVDPTLPVVICSAALDERRVTLGLSLGAAGFIVKPPTRELVLDGVREALPADRRLQSRVRIAVPVVVEESGAGAVLETVTVNLSSSGVLLGCEPLGLGEHVRIQVRLDDGSPEDRPVEAVARVVRITHDGHPALMFQRISLRDHERLTELVDTFEG